MRSPWEIVQLTLKDFSPPLYYFFLHYWMILFGTTEAGIRGLSILFHVLTILIAFLIARNIIASRIGQLGLTFAVALNPFLVQYAFEARPYSMLAFLTTLCVYLLITERFFLASIPLALAILTHNFGILTTGALAIWWIAAFRTRIKQHYRNALLLFTLPTLSLLGWGSVIWNQWTKLASGFWIKPPTLSSLLHTFDVFVGGDMGYEIQPLIYSAALILIALASSVWIVKKGNSQHSRSVYLFLAASIIPVLMAFGISVLLAPIYLERYLISSVPVLIFLGGYSLHWLYETQPSMRTAIIAIVSIYLMLLILGYQQITAKTTKPAINWGMKQILSQAWENDIIIPKDFLNFLEAKFYVQTSGKTIPVYVYLPKGELPFYIGKILYTDADIIRTLPQGQRVWQIKPNGGYELLNK